MLDSLIPPPPPLAGLKYRRIVLKLSGEALCGEEGGFGIRPETLHTVAAELAELSRMGVQIGIVVGESDRNAEYPASRPITVEDVAATLYRALGIDADRMFQSPDGRPIRIADGGEPVHELF